MDNDTKRVEEAVEGLIEHFDTVQVFCTRHDGKGEGTIAVNIGRGNWYARFGICREWIIRAEEEARMMGATGEGNL